MDNAFCFLTNTLPTEIKINNKAIAIETSTATAVACLLYIERSDIPTDLKAEYVCLRLFRKSYNEMLQEFNTTSVKLDNVIMMYLRGANEIRPKADKGSIKKTFDFVQDSGAIIASFRQMYGLSIKEVQALHYWEFLALFENLSGENAFNNVRHIRNMNIDKKDSPERKEEIKRLKRSVALVDRRTSEEKRNDLQRQLNALM